MRTVDAAALVKRASEALCNYDEQRHLRLENRTGEPCVMHQNQGWHVINALLPMLAKERP